MGPDSTGQGGALYDFSWKGDGSGNAMVLYMDRETHKVMSGSPVMHDCGGPTPCDYAIEHEI